MAQSSLLESVKEKTGKFSVSVDRVVNLDNYESLRVGFAEVLDLGAEKPEEAYARILQKVNGWTAELKPAKPKLPSPLDVTSIRTEPTINIDDHYLALPWKQSQKKSNLATILVTQEILENPTAKELFDKVKEWKTMKVGLVSYRYSKMPDGPEFLQKWSQVKLG